MDSKQSTLEKEHLQDASSDQIRREIRGTRREMDETIDHLGDRLHPRHLLDDVIDLFRGSDGGASSKRQIAHSMKGASKTVAHEIREHPLPAMLVGAGLAWWLFDSMGGNDRDEDRRGYYDGDDPDGYAYAGNLYEDGTTRPLGTVAGYVPEADYDDLDPAMSSTRGEYADTEGTYTQGAYAQGQRAYAGSDVDEPGAMDKAREMAAAAGEKVSDAAHTVGSKLSSAASHVGDSVSGAAHSVGHQAASARHRAGSAMHGGASRAAQYRSRGGRAISRGSNQAQERFRETSDEYPLAVGAAFLAAGLLAGLLMPRTEREDEWMGEASDDLMDETRQMGREVVQRGKAVLNETASTAMDEAESRGATPGNLADKVGHVVSAAVEAGKETAREEGISAHDLKETAKAVGHTAAETAQTRGNEGAQQVAPKQS